MGSQIHWHTTTRGNHVSTPVYTGDAVKTVFCETPLDGTSTNETWYFAPFIGRVEIRFPFSGGYSEWLHDKASGAPTLKRQRIESNPANDSTKPANGMSSA